MGDARNGVYDSGLFFSGSNGYRLNRLQSVQELIEKLVGLREDTDTWEEDPSIPDEVAEPRTASAG